MKSSASFLTKLLAAALMLMVTLQACEKPECVLPAPLVVEDVIFGEMHDGVPVLTYPNYDRLKDAMKFAFPANTPIDTAFLHVEGESMIYLTAIGLVDTEDAMDVPHSVNFRFAYTTGLIHSPLDLFYCIPSKGCPGCIANLRDCYCTSSHPILVPGACIKVGKIYAAPMGGEGMLPAINKYLSVQ
jgi:hypothetical protein